MLAAVEEDVSDSLTSLSAAAAGTRDSWDVLIEEKVVKSDLLGPQLYQQRALSLAEPLMELQHLLGGRWCVPVCCSAFLVFSPCAYPLSCRLSLAPFSKRCPEWV